MALQLIPLAGGPRIDIAFPIVLLGFGEECDVRLEDETVSETHCVLATADGMVFCRDLGSTGGTRVNGQRVRRAVLLQGDTLGIGQSRFCVEYAPGG